MSKAISQKKRVQTDKKRSVSARLGGVKKNTGGMPGYTQVTREFFHIPPSHSNTVLEAFDPLKTFDPLEAFNTLKASSGNLDLSDTIQKESFSYKRINKSILVSTLRLFLTGFIQVFFVAVNTVFLSNSNYWGVSIFSFLISFVWTFNVKKIAFGNFLDKIVYSIGAMTGSLLGLLFTKLFNGN